MTPNEKTKTDELWMSIYQIECLVDITEQNFSHWGSFQNYNQNVIEPKNILGISIESSEVVVRLRLQKKVMIVYWGRIVLYSVKHTQICIISKFSSTLPQARNQTIETWGAHTYEKTMLGRQKKN